MRTLVQVTAVEDHSLHVALRVGDVILSCEGDEVRSVSLFEEIFRIASKSARKGGAQSIPVRVLRNGQQLDLSLPAAPTEGVRAAEVSEEVVRQQQESEKRAKLRDAELSVPPPGILELLSSKVGRDVHVNVPPGTFRLIAASSAEIVLLTGSTRVFLPMRWLHHIREREDGLVLSIFQPILAAPSASPGSPSVDFQVLVDLT